MILGKIVPKNPALFFKVKKIINLSDIFQIKSQVAKVKSFFNKY